MIHGKVGQAYLSVAVVTFLLTGLSHPPGCFSELPGLFLFFSYILFADNIKHHL